jgi:hypothetical protein
MIKLKKKIKEKSREKKCKFGLTQLTRHQQHEIRIKKIIQKKYLTKTTKVKEKKNIAKGNVS